MTRNDPCVIQTFLKGRPEGERAIEAVLAVDAVQETWTFDDVEVNSGTFGELVSRGIVETVDGEYQVTDRNVLATALGSEELDEGTGDAETPAEDLGFDVGVFGDRDTFIGLLGALGLLFVMRILNVRSIFQGDHVVSPANDPYFYRYWTEALLAESTGVTDLGLITDLPPGAAAKRPLTHVSNWFLAELLGGDQWAADVVAAWLPVVAALALGIVIYCLAVVVTRDVRVGIASVVLFAFTPIHAVYSGIGFIEHRLYQYFWLGITLLTLAWLAMDFDRRLGAATTVERAVRSHLHNPSTWVVSAFLGIALGLSAHIWGGSVLMFVPLSGYVALKVALDVRDGIPPGMVNLPLVAGVGLGGAIAASLHFGFGWHEPFAGVVPLLVFAGGVCLLGLGEYWRRTGWSVQSFLATMAVGALVGLVGFRTVRPAEWGGLMDRSDDLLLREGYIESSSLFDPDLAFVLGPVSQIGVEFYIALVFLGWACWAVTRRYEPAWLLLSVYSVFWLVMAAIQARFTAQLVISLSVFSGLGFVYVMSWVDLARVPAVFDSDEGTGFQAASGEDSAIRSIEFPSDGRTIVYILGIALLVCGMSLVYVPSLVAQTAHEEEQVEAALVMEEHAEEHDREWRDNAVFSQMGDNRMYNYFVSGESKRYVQEAYWEFVYEDSPDEWKETFDGRFGYVIADQEHDLPPHQLGAGGERTLDHYQLLYISEDRDLAAFAIVDGATITESVESSETVTVRTEVVVDGAAFTYEREVDVVDGEFSIVVPYPGEYSVDSRSVTVTDEDVESGSIVRAK